MRSVGIIPARGGSKRLPNKNLKLLNGKPLIAHTIEQAKKSKLDEVYVSSENTEILVATEEYGCNWIRRPEEFATDTSSTIETVKHAVNFLENVAKVYFDAILILQPTSPQRDYNLINRALRSTANVLVTVQKNDDYTMKLNGAIFMLRRHLLDDIKNPSKYLIDDLISLDEDICFLFTNPLIDIDTFEEFQCAEEALKCM